MAATMGNSDANRRLRPMFEALSLAVRGLEDLRRLMPCSQKESEAISEMREALWLRLRCTQMQLPHGMGTALVYEEAELVGDNKKESTAVANGKKLDDQFKAPEESSEARFFRWRQEMPHFWRQFSHDEGLS
jgi:hypothetical protein